MNSKTLEMARKAHALRVEGHKYREIGEVLGVTSSRAEQLVVAQQCLDASNDDGTHLLSARTQACLKKYVLDTKDKAKAAVMTGWLSPHGTDQAGKPIVNFGQKSFDEVCQWAGVENVSNDDKAGDRSCDHNRRLIHELRAMLITVWGYRAWGIPEKELFEKASRLLTNRQMLDIRPYDSKGWSVKPKQPVACGVVGGCTTKKL